MCRLMTSPLHKGKLAAQHKNATPTVCWCTMPLWHMTLMLTECCQYCAPAEKSFLIKAPPVPINVLILCVAKQVYRAMPFLFLYLTVFEKVQPSTWTIQ